MLNYFCLTHLTALCEVSYILWCDWSLKLAMMQFSHLLLANQPSHYSIMQYCCTLSHRYKCARYFYLWKHPQAPKVLKIWTIIVSLYHHLAKGSCFTKNVSNNFSKTGLFQKTLIGHYQFIIGLLLSKELCRCVICTWDA